jgi:hypothetical protein
MTMMRADPCFPSAIRVGHPTPHVREAAGAACKLGMIYPQTAHHLKVRSATYHQALLGLRGRASSV